MNAHALLINCARGGIVDERALASALQTGAIAGAGVDVLSSEPPGQRHVLLDVHHPRLIVTPHLAWLSHTSLRNLADQLIENIEAFVQGQPRHLVFADRL
jgi:glycerate dehydrogenase